MEAGTFQTVIPSRYISFTLPMHSLSCSNDYFHAKNIQISVLDSPLQQPNNPINVAAMLVPKNQENDWIFTTEAGLFQLLYGCHGVSRLVLIGNEPESDESVGKLCERSVEMDPCLREEVERSLYPLLMVLLPKGVDKVGPFLSYEDNVVGSVVLERCVGPFVGEMVVEDVEVEEACVREFRRRLRFKRMPNMVQTEVCVKVKGRGVDGEGLDGLRIGKAEFVPDLGRLVHPYLAPMVAGLSLIGGCLQELFESGVRPRGLCIGVGGGALLSFLSVQLGFEVVGVEVDEVVLRVAKEYFGLQAGKDVHLCVGDGIEILKKVACFDCDRKLNLLVVNGTGQDCRRDDFGVFGSKFDVIMVDLDSSDSKMGITAPTSEFVQKDALLAAKSSLSEHGILVVNVIPLSRPFYSMVINTLQEVFVDLHELECVNQENYVLIASVMPIVGYTVASESAFMRKLKSVISGVLIDSIRKL